MSKHKRKIKRHRSAITGRYVTEKDARKHPKTTVTETYVVPTKKK